MFIVYCWAISIEFLAICPTDKLIFNWLNRQIVLWNGIHVCAIVMVEANININKISIRPKHIVLNWILSCHDRDWSAHHRLTMGEESNHTVWCSTVGDQINLSMNISSYTWINDGVRGLMVFVMKHTLIWGIKLHQ